MSLGCFRYAMFQGPQDHEMLLNRWKAADLVVVRKRFVICCKQTLYGIFTDRFKDRMSNVAIEKHERVVFLRLAIDDQWFD